MSTFPGEVLLKSGKRVDKTLSMVPHGEQFFHDFYVVRFNGVGGRREEKFVTKAKAECLYASIKH